MVLRNGKVTNAAGIVRGNRCRSKAKTVVAGGLTGRIVLLIKFFVTGAITGWAMI